MSELIPSDDPAQRRIERQWLSAVRDRTAPRGVRPLVRASWRRSLWAEVSPDLPRAPIALEASALDGAISGSDWVGVAAGVMGQHQRSFAGEGHILTLFDHEATMLLAEGDPAALEGLADINFRPGAVWAETEVGTNGPGTALATGQAAHIVGAEHFCERWHRWHCAAVPIREAATGRVLGVLDISGFRDSAHPHTLNLAAALALAVERTLAAREVERRYLVLSRLADLSARYPGDPTVGVDRHGRILAASPSAPPALRPGRSSELLEAVIQDLVERAEPEVAREVSVPVTAEHHRRAVWYPVLDAGRVVGGCLVLEPATARSAAFDARIPAFRALARNAFELAARQLGRFHVPVDPDVYDAMQAYHWPGELRELRAVTRRMVQGMGGRLTLRDLPQAIRASYVGVVNGPRALAGPAARAVLAAESMIDVEDAELIDAVSSSRTMAEAAARLGITRSTLYRRMERSGLRPRRVVDRP